MQLKDVINGEFFTLKPIGNPKESQVYVKGVYDRKEKKYSCHKFSDVNDERFFKSDKIVYTDFTF